MLNFDKLLKISIMKRKLLFLFFLPSIMLSQIGNGFENLQGVTFASTTCYYVDPDVTTVHEIDNFNASCGTIYVKEASSGNTLGYSIVFTPYTPSSLGFSEGDAFGVGNAQSFVNGLNLAPPEGVQAFYMADPDGKAVMTFDEVELIAGTNPLFSMQYILEGTSWEWPNDYVKITLEITGCASSATVSLLDTFVMDTDDFIPSIEDTWNTLSANLTSYIGCKAKLVVEFSSDSTSEELGLDDIYFTGGVQLSTKTFSLNDSIEIFPNPSNGNITIKNSGIALDNVLISDLNGRTIIGYDLNGTTANKSLDLGTTLSSGMYLVSITSENQSIVKKLIIK